MPRDIKDCVAHALGCLQAARQQPDKRYSFRQMAREWLVEGKRTREFERTGVQPPAWRYEQYARTGKYPRGYP